MKLPILATAFVLAALFVVGPKASLEARHHSYFSLNVGPVVSWAPQPYVVESYPAYVQERVYVDPYGYPYNERVYVRPAPRVYYAPAPAFYSGFGFGFRFR